MRQHKDKWIDDVMESMHDIRRAPAPAGLFDRIERKLGTSSIVRTIPFRTVSLAAASILLLLILNILLATGYRLKKESLNDSMQAQAVADYYGLTDNYGI